MTRITGGWYDTVAGPSQSIGEKLKEMAAEITRQYEQTRYQYAVAYEPPRDADPDAAISCAVRRGWVGLSISASGRPRPPAPAIGPAVPAATVGNSREELFNQGEAAFAAAGTPRRRPSGTRRPTTGIDAGSSRCSSWGWSRSTWATSRGRSSGSSRRSRRIWARRKARRRLRSWVRCPSRLLKKALLKQEVGGLNLGSMGSTRRDRGGATGRYGCPASTARRRPWVTAYFGRAGAQHLVRPVQAQAAVPAPASGRRWLARRRRDAATAPSLTTTTPLLRSVTVPAGTWRAVPAPFGHGRQQFPPLLR